jgi:YHS domain-containing protein
MNSPSDRVEKNHLTHQSESPVTRLLLTVLALVLFTSPALAQKSGRERVLKIDAVELIDHQREVEGTTEFQHRHGRYLYLFANAANAATFKADPAKYEIQLGGACGRMGALSGEGSPKLFAVHDGRLYIFASEQCKRSFL